MHLVSISCRNVAGFLRHTHLWHTRSTAFCSRATRPRFSTCSVCRVTNQDGAPSTWRAQVMTARSSLQAKAQRTFVLCFLSCTRCKCPSHRESYLDPNPVHQALGPPTLHNEIFANSNLVDHCAAHEQISFRDDRELGYFCAPHSPDVGARATPTLRSPILQALASAARGRGGTSMPTRGTS